MLTKIRSCVKLKDLTSISNADFYSKFMPVKFFYYFFPFFQSVKVFDLTKLNVRKIHNITLELVKIFLPVRRRHAYGAFYNFYFFYHGKICRSYPTTSHTPKFYPSLKSSKPPLNSLPYITNSFPFLPEFPFTISPQFNPAQPHSPLFFNGKSHAISHHFPY